MKKRVLATVLTVCLLFSALACVANAATIEVGEIISNVRICPGTTIDQKVEKPTIEVGVYAQGWEVKTADGLWIPYDGEPIDEYAGTFSIRYFASDAQGNYYYSPNECVVTTGHNPKGSYQYDALSHWKICADCGGEADVETHTHMGSTATSGDKVCQVCGHVRTPQWTGLLSFFDWIFALITALGDIF